MKLSLSSVSLPGKLALAALGLGALALFAIPTARAVTIQPRSSPHGAKRSRSRLRAGARRLDPPGEERLRLIDLRDAAAFAAYHIPSAETLRSPSCRATVWRANERSSSTPRSIHSAQAWFLLWRKGSRGLHPARRAGRVERPHPASHGDRRGLPQAPAAVAAPGEAAATTGAPARPPKKKRRRGAERRV